jgi:hypothetical protein
MDLYNLNFHKSIEDDEIPQAYRISLYIKEFLQPNYIIDFGCSTGIYLNEIKKNIQKIEFVGYEYSKDACDNSICENILNCDLTQKLDVEKRKNTLGICLEVLEHIDDKYWFEVLSNITKLSDIIIFSAAHPGQGGIGHINCRPKIDWIKRFHSLGWVVDYDLTTHFINYMTSGYHMGWLRMNGMILIKV